MFVCICLDEIKEQKLFHFILTNTDSVAKQCSYYKIIQLLPPQIVKINSQTKGCHDSGKGILKHLQSIYIIIVIVRT